MKVEIRRDFSVKIVICYLLSALLLEGDSMDQEAENRKKRWTRSEVETALKEILIDALDVDKQMRLGLGKAKRDGLSYTSRSPRYQCYKTLQ